MPRRKETALELVEALVGGWFAYVWAVAVGLIGALLRLAFGLVVFALVLGTHLLRLLAVGQSRPVQTVARRRRRRGRAVRPALSLVPVWTPPKKRRRGTP